MLLDCFTRLPRKQHSDPEPLWIEVKKFVTLKGGYLIVDDKTLDKSYSKKIGFVRYQWSGKHHRTDKGIGLITLIWTDDENILPVDFRIYDIDEDEKSKNDHFLEYFLICLRRPKNADLNQSSLCSIHSRIYALMMQNRVCQMP